VINMVLAPLVALPFTLIVPLTLSPHAELKRTVTSRHCEAAMAPFVQLTETDPQTSMSAGFSHTPPPRGR
jgi:hypothetical protein